jgi:hypothetical protein
MEELPQLRSAGSQSIQCFGELAAEVCFIGHQFTWTFLLAAVEEPLLGSDVLKHYRLAVDMASNLLLDASNMQIVAVGELAAAGGLAALCSTPPPPPPQLDRLLKKFPEVLSESGKLPPVRHDIKRAIITTGRPVTARFRRLDAAKLAAAKKELEADGKAVGS